MQELIERLDKEINSKYPDGYNIVMEIAKDLTEQMLEKEKEVMSQVYADGGDWDEVPQPRFENYYNAHFKTKEK